MAPEALVIAAFGLVGAILSIAGLRLSGQLRQVRTRLLAEVDAREKQGQRLAELDALRGRAVEARDLADGLRREVSGARSEITALKEQIEQQKVDLLRANAAASDAMKKRSEMEAKLAELTAAAEAADHTLHDNVKAARERASLLEKQLLEAQKKLATAQAEGAKLTRSTSKAEADARAAAEAAGHEARALRVEAEEQRVALEAAWGEARALAVELDQVKAELEAEALKRIEAEQRAAGSGTSPVSAGGSGKGGVIAALEGDPGLNRGQRETIRMMYDKFTAKTGKG